MSGAVDQFLRTILKSGLLDYKRLKATLRTVPPNRREQPKQVAELLVEAKLLTPYQSHKLLQGVTLGLRLGNHAIQVPIGRGGMGTVYLARDERNGQLVAIKVLAPKRAREGERHLQRFQREMAISQKLLHPNVARTLEVGVHRGVHYIVMEYIPGQTLSRLVQSQGALSVPRAARLFAEIAAALEHAHQQGLIHRDIKPSNFMVTPDDHVKLLDLGLAMMEGEEVEDAEVVGGKGYIVGSVEYIAPEQTRDPTQIDARADLYAMGCALYFTVTGKVPFGGTTSKEKIHAHRHLEPEPVQLRNPAVPDAFARVIHKLMAKDPNQRPPSASAVRQEMLAWADSSAPPIVDLEASAAQQARAALQDTNFAPGDTLNEFNFATSSRDEVIDSGLFDHFFEEEERRQRLLWWLVIGASTFAGLVFVILMIVLLVSRS